MNEEFKEGLNQEAQQQVCTDLREIISDILHARDNFRTIVQRWDLPVSDLSSINRVSDLLGDIDIIENKVEEDAG